jgi:hypothetical protein
MFRENKQFTQKIINEVLVFAPVPKMPRVISIKYLFQVDRIKFVEYNNAFWMLVRNLADKYEIVDCFDPDNIEEKFNHWFVYKDERK